MTCYSDETCKTTALLKAKLQSSAGKAKQTTTSQVFLKIETWTKLPEIHLEA